MTGQEIINFLKTTNMDTGFSSALEVTAFDGIPTSVKFNGQPIDTNHTYTVAINSYMYAHPPTGWTWSDTSPLTSNVLCRDGIVDYMRDQHPDQAQAYTVGGDRYHLNTEFSGGYRAVVTMMNDNDTKPVYEYAFVRLLNATDETLARRGSKQVPTDLVNADGSINTSNRLAEQEIYRSYLGFKTGGLRPGDIIETWGKGSFYGGNPEFVDQEGIYADGVEFKIVGHDDSLAQPIFMPSIASFWNDSYKNHYVQFHAKKAGASTVYDQYGQTVTVWDATGYAAKTLPGNVGDMLLISGVPTMESYALRFRSDSAVASTDSFPAIVSVSSSVDPVAGTVTTSPLTLTSTASATSATWYISPTADAQVVSGSPSSNYGTSTNLYVQSSNSGAYKDERAWLKFDLSGIPAGSTISSAALQLWNWKSAGAALPTEVHGGDSDGWIESGTGSITWANQPTFGPALNTQTLAAGASSLWYSWDVTSFAQGKWSGNKLVSLVVRAATEDSTDATAPSYAFDSKEYGSNAPILQVSAQDSVARVQYFYRYSSDGSSWGAWTSYGSVTTAPWTISFTYPSGAGYYEFYSVGIDAAGNVSLTPTTAQASTLYSPLAANGQCGSSNGGTFTTAPSSNLCSSGTGTSVSGTGPWTWSCSGSNGGSDASCLANIQTFTITFDSSTGGGLTGFINQTINYGLSASSVTAVPTSGYHFLNWTGTNGFETTTSNPLIVTNVTTDQTITANFALDATNGACGSSNGLTLSSGPTTNLCSTGDPSVVSGTGPWSWTCSGLNGGSTDYCQASYASDQAQSVPGLGPWGLVAALAILAALISTRRKKIKHQ
ncbi:MAG TPA: DNRLRE domain-containing protein, partial [Syntrophorhabdaceae bacterium]|nr:DNRLRE domain-containing protein [Syntrophorhabdaceae bacterium]